MKRILLVALALGSMAGQPAAAQSNGDQALGTVHIARKLMANGQLLPAGTYQVRLTSEEPKPGVGQSQGAERFVEFVRGGKVVGREVATVVSADDIGSIAKGKKPSRGASSVEMLKGGDFWRVWINRGGTSYIINMPPA